MTIGIHAKRGIEATFEKIILASNTRRNIRVCWSGKGAGVVDKGINTTLLLPAIRDDADISHSELSKLVGFAVHEFGHVLYTNAAEWNAATESAGNDRALLHRLINGLEDPRIEKKVIDSDYCANARNLFESVLSNVLLKDYKGGDYVDPDDVDNIAFQLAVEGRRRNGYSVIASPVYQRSIYADAIEHALNLLPSCNDTGDVVKVAKSLLLSIKQKQKEQEQKQGQDQSEGESDGSDESGDAADQSADEPGDAADQPADEPGDDERKDGQSSKGDQLAIEPSDAIRDSLSKVCDDFTQPSITVKRNNLVWS